MELGEGSRGSVNCYIGELIIGGQCGAGGRELAVQTADFYWPHLIPK